MNKIITSVSICFFLLSTITNAQKSNNAMPDLDIQKLENDFMKWWTYHKNTIFLSYDFVALDDSLNPISKEAFLKSLFVGNHIPIKLSSTTSSIYYKLHKLRKDADINIKSALINDMAFIYANFQMEGKTFPHFDIVDLNENRYNSQNTKGKIVVVKTWFIRCVACIKEFPELNELVQKYKNRDDVTFISLALDSKEDLQHFLSKKPFDYPVVADQSKLITEDLGLEVYPTHIIVDQNGIIKAVTSSAKEMITILEKRFL